MTTITPATAIGTTQSESTPTNPNGTLEQNGFLKLMVAQLQAQNPLEPSNGDEYIGELAQFTEVEQMTNLANAGEISGAVQLIGHEVAYTGSSGATEKGTVESVQSTANGTTVTVSGVGGIKQTQITEVS